MNSSNPEHPDLELSGRCFTREQLVEDGSVPQLGDLKLYHGLDFAGRIAMAGRHTNYGYSGTVRALIWDGCGWRRMRLISLLGDHTWFPAKQSRDDAYMRVRQLVPQLAGQAVCWDGKRYVRPEDSDSP